MNKHLIILLIADLYMGFGAGTVAFGVKAGVGVIPVIIIFVSGYGFYLFASFTSGAIIRDALKTKAPSEDRA